MEMRRIASMCLLVALLECPAWADIINGSFETGDFTGWYVDDVFGSAAVVDGGTDGWKAARLKPEGRNTLDGDPPFVPGYVFVGQNLTVPHDACYILFDAWVEGDAIGYSDLVNPDFPEVTITSLLPATYSLDVSSRRGEQVLFGVVARDTAPGDNYVYFDNVRFTDIPEPGTLALCATGALWLLTLRRVV